MRAKLGSLGRDWETLAVAVKPYPAAFYSHGCIEAAIHLATTHDLDVAEIVAVEVFVPPPVLPKLAEPHAAKVVPATVSEAQFALPFLVARALLARRFGLKELAPETLADPATLALARLVSCKAEEGMDFPRFYPGRVTVTHADGRRFTRTVDINLGAFERPVDERFIMAKFAENRDNSDMDRLGRVRSLLASFL